MGRKIVFNYEDYLLCVDCFLLYVENEAKDIAKELNIPKYIVDYYIDCYLSLKNNYSGVDVGVISSPFKYKKTNNPSGDFEGKGIEVELYEDNELIGKFNSLSSASNFLGISHFPEKTVGLQKTTINHTKIGRTITYKKL